MPIVEQPILSIGMPAYNSEQDLEAAIDAILAQTFENFELIISDNGSTDRTQEICEAYCRQDKRVNYHRNSENIGASGNYNKVFELSRAKYFKWASSNDHCEPDFFERCIDALEQNPKAVLAYPKTRLYSGRLDNYFDYQESLSTVGMESPAERMAHVIDELRLNNIMNGIFLREVLAKTPLMIPFFASDSCLMAEVALYGEFEEIDEYLFYRQMDQESSTSMQDTETMTEHYQPGSNKPMRFQNWKAYLFYLSAIMRSDLMASEKLKACKEIARRMVWHKSKLFRDFLFWKPFRSSTSTNWKEL